MNYKNIIPGFDIVDPTQMLGPLTEYANKGALQGKYLGFPNIHKHYSMALPGVTDWTGKPDSGKTQLLMESLLVTSEYYGWKHLVYFPDVGNAEEVLADLVHKVVGKPFEKKYSERINEFEIATGLTWVCEHFKILTKKDLKAKLTPYQFWDLAVKIKQEEGLQTASIDSWKDMKHDITSFGRDDKYLEDVLSYRNSIADANNLHLHTVIHPTRTEKDKNGDRTPPGPYDLKGGSEWYNNGRSMITVHRPTDRANIAEVYFNKIKPRSIGCKGNIELNFDLYKFRYYIEVGGQRRYAEKDIYELETDVAASVEDDGELPF